MMLGMVDSDGDTGSGADGEGEEVVEEGEWG
jgi:hypothetical protein